MFKIFLKEFKHLEQTLQRCSQTETLGTCHINNEMLKMCLPYGVIVVRGFFCVCGKNGCHFHCNNDIISKCPTCERLLKERGIPWLGRALSAWSQPEFHLSILCITFDYFSTITSSYTTWVSDRA